MNNDKYYHGRKSRNRAILTPVQDWGKYQRHRLPGVVVTKKGTVIIYCEARTELETDRVGSGSDWCMKDIYVRRSTDGGETFELPQYIAFGDRVAESMDNPVMTVAEDNTLHLLYSKNFCLAPHGGIWYTRSTDDGVTWWVACKIRFIVTKKGVPVQPLSYVDIPANERRKWHSRRVAIYDDRIGETAKLVTGGKGERLEASYKLKDDDLYVRARIESDWPGQFAGRRSLHPHNRTAWTQPYGHEYKA